MVKVIDGAGIDGNHIGVGFARQMTTPGAHHHARRDYGPNFAPTFHHLTAAMFVFDPRRFNSGAQGERDNLPGRHARVPHDHQARNDSESNL